MNPRMNLINNNNDGNTGNENYDRQIKRGDLLYVSLNPVVGSEQGEDRPAVVVQNDVGNKHSPTIIIAPITCNLRKNPLPTHKVIPKKFGLEADSLVLMEQIRTIDRSRILRYIGRVDERVQKEIDTALSVSLGLLRQYLPDSKLFDLCLCYACESDFIEAGYRLVKKGFTKNLGECDCCKSRRGYFFRVYPGES